MTDPAGQLAADAIESGMVADTARAERDALASNTGAMLAGRMLIAAMGWTGTKLIIDHLTKEKLGEFTFVFALLGMLSIITEMGVGRVAVNSMMDDGVDRGRFAGTYVVMRTLMGVVGYALALAFVVLLRYPPVIVRTTAVAGLVVLFATPNHAFHLAFQTTMRMPRVAAAEVAGQAAQLALTIAVIVKGGTVTWLAVPAVLCEITILSLLFPMARRLVRYHFVVDVSMWWKLLREAVPITIGTTMAIIYYRIDALMLQRIKGNEALAVYGVAYKFVDLAHFMVIALSVPILTLLVRAWPHDHAAFRAAIGKGLTLLATAATVVLVMAMLFADKVVPLIYRGGYEASAAATRIVLLGECIGWFGSLAFSILVATDRHRRYPIVTGTGLVLNVVLNLIVIPRWSYNGAAVDTLITEVVVAAPLWLLVRRIPETHGVGAGRLLRLVPIGLVVAAAGYGLRRALPWGLAAAIVLAALLVAIHLARATGQRGLRDLLARGAA